MKKIILSGFILMFSFGSVYPQSLDINLLRKINSPNPDQQEFWMATSNSVFWVPAAYTFANLAYGLAEKDNTALSYSLESALSTSIGMAISESIKLLVNRPRPTQTYPNLIHSYRVILMVNHFLQGILLRPLPLLLLCPIRLNTGLLQFQYSPGPLA